MIRSLLRKLICVLIAAATAAAALLGCSGSPEADARWYLHDKPAEMRVPVSGQSDPGELDPPIDDIGD